MGHHIENGTLFINAGEPYLEHHGVLGMKWGKHLRAGKGPASAPSSAGGGGGGAPEEDEKTKKKIEEAAKKAGMSVDDYRKKFADKIAEIKKAAYNAAGGNHKTEAERFREMSRSEQNKARQAEGKAHENSAKAASQDRKYGSGGDVYRRAADMNKRDAEVNRGNAKMYQDIAQDQQSKYEKSLAGRYDRYKAAKKRKRKSRLKVTHNVTVTKVTVPKHTLPRLKHSDDTNAIYTEGTRLVVNSKWG